MTQWLLHNPWRPAVIVSYKLITEVLALLVFLLAPHLEVYWVRERHAVLCGCGHNIRLIIAHLKAIWAEILAILMANFGTARAPKSTEFSPRALEARCS